MPTSAVGTFSPTYATDSLDESTLSFIDVDGIRTRVYQSGQGPTLILFSGGHIGSLYCIDSYSLNLPSLEQQFHVVAIDKIGQGATGAPEHDENLTWESTVHHAMRTIEVLGLSDVHLAGHSRGGMLISELAYRMPGQVKSVIIIDSATLAPTEPGPNFYAGLPKHPAGTLEAVRVEPEAQAFKPEQITDDFVRRMLALSQDPEFCSIQERMEQGASATFLASLELAHDAILKRIAAEGLPVPTLMLWDFNDRSAPVSSGYKLLEIIAEKTPWTEFHVFNQGGHYTFRENPESFNRLVSSWIHDVESRTS